MRLPIRYLTAFLKCLPHDFTGICDFPIFTQNFLVREMPLQYVVKTSLIFLAVETAFCCMVSVIHSGLISPASGNSAVDVLVQYFWVTQAILSTCQAIAAV